LTAAGIETFRAGSPSSARAALGDAARAAMAGRTVALLLPVDVQLASLSEPGGPPLDGFPPPGPAPRPASARALGTAARILEKSERPLVLAGVGAHRAGARDALERLAEHIGALLITTARGKELFRGSRWNLGVLGSFSHRMARRYVDQADCVIAFGASLNFFTMSFGRSLPEVPLVQVDAVRDHIGRYSTVDAALVGDARLVAEQLREALPSRAEKPFHAGAVQSDLESFEPARDFRPENTARTLDPRAVGVALDRLLPEDRNLVYDAGNFLGVVPYLSVPDPGHFKFTSDFASIGMGFGTALGFAFGRPVSTTVFVTGDGGFMMTLSEMETAAREGVPLVVVVMNDCAYGAELHFLRMRQLPVEKSVFPDVDLAPIAEGFAFEAATIRTLADLEGIAPRLQAPDGPILLDCKINADVAAPFMSEFAEFERSAH